jgi:hypothetical protein
VQNLLARIANPAGAPETTKEMGNDMNRSPRRAVTLFQLSLGASGILLLSPAALAVPLTLQVDTPWQTSGINTGSLGTSQFEASSSRWATSFTADWAGYGSSGLFGSLARELGVVGDFMTLSLVTGVSDTLTITFHGPVLDPIFYFIDLNSPGSTLTIPSGGDTFTSSGGAVWNGDIFVPPAQTGPDLPITYGAVQYEGLFGADSEFSFVLDFRTTSVQIFNDLVGIGISSSELESPPPVPEPGTFALLGLGLMGLGFSRRRLSP